MAQTKNQLSLTIKKTINAPLERVFRAWSDPKILMIWWKAGDAYEASLAEVDFSEGGKYRLGMKHIESGNEHIVGGEYKEIIPNEKIVFSWAWEIHNPEEVSEVCVEFKTTENGTEVILTHSGFQTEASMNEHNKGWNACLEPLAAVFTIEN